MILTLANNVRNSIWKIMGRITIGVRVIVIRDHSILLVQHTYKKGWYLPGGGLKSKETLGEAARREVFEETGFHLRELSLLGVYTDFSEGRSDHVAVFSAEAVKQEKRKDYEIKRIEFFPLDKLPENLAPGCLRRIQEYMNNQSSNHGIW